SRLPADGLAARPPVGLSCAVPARPPQSGRTFMAEYQLYCFAQSGNAYRAALMLQLMGADWEPVFVDFFNGETRRPDYRNGINEMGEVPVLVHAGRRLSQSGVILGYLAERSGKFAPQGEDERME